MKRFIILITWAITIGSTLLLGCTSKPVQPAGTISVGELLESPVYNAPIRVYGQVSGLGEFMCTCFFLNSDGENLHVWYDTMVEDNGTLRPAVRVDEINNGDWVVVTGELKTAGQHYSVNDFWMGSVEVIQ